ncbi:MAG: polysaccharide biosynthesis C-terminal domain-containing protein [Bacteroidota bacterium]
MKDKGSIQTPSSIFPAQFDLLFARNLAGPGLKIIAVNIMAAAAFFAINFLLVRVLGEAGYGQYVILNLWITILTVVCLAGMDDFFVALLPQHLNTENKKNIYGTVLAWSLRLCGLVILVVIAFIFLLSVEGHLHPVIVQHRLLFTVVLTCATLLMVLVSFTRAIGHPVVSQMADKLVRGIALLTFIAVLYFAGNFSSLTAILLLQLSTIILAVIVLIVFLRNKVQFNTTFVYFDKSRKSNITFLAISLLYLLSTRFDLIFLERSTADDLLGHYNIAARISDLAAFPVMALNLLAPVLLSEVVHNQKERLSPIFKTVLLFATGITLAVLLILLLVGKPILGFFGPRFTSAFTPLVILCVAQFLAAIAAPHNALLMVCGFQRLSLFALLVFVIFSFTLCFFLVPAYGSNGAAYSMLGGQAGYLIVTCWLAHRHVLRPAGSIQSIQ